MIIYLPFFVCIVGLLMWALCKTEPPKSIGMWMFICGLLVTLFEIGSKTIHIP